MCCVIAPAVPTCHRRATHTRGAGSREDSIVEMDRTRLAIVIGAVVVVAASIVGFMAGGGDADTTETDAAAASTTAAPDGSGDGVDDVDLPVTGDRATGPTTSSSGTASTTAASGPATTAGGTATTAAGSTPTSADSTATTITFSSSPPATEGEKRGCPEGLVLVGSNGTEPICQTPGAGCPDSYAVIGGVDGALLCKGEAGDVLRIHPDGTVTIDEAIGFDGPVCQRTDSQGRVIELTLAVDEADCTARGGQFFPDGLD